MLTSLALGIGVYLFVGVTVLADPQAGAYSHVAQTISELGARGAPRSGWANRGVFLPVGVGLWSLSLLSLHVSEWAALLSGCLGVGYALGAIFPCDRGMPPLGSRRQLVHDFAGTMEYGGSMYALSRLADGPGPRFLFLATAIVVPLAVAPTFISGARRYRGIFQRVAELMIFASLTLALAVHE